ncbi:histidinol dehydrogenase [Microbacterium sp. VKM Ac-2870]|uniref:histidinol dehydrogenase n=1 Tax=Microbacterium sp. VKM Ac-2870 TaxID=2783825 RepID=UPI00188D407B|nr:histidinol dehydrogenase [Microbacterium sp. VKM Ac-2870]MBF4560553.1 histidinol dehydrogenase [Microbacterium sp. VKM Ac-2870]
MRIARIGTWVVSVVIGLVYGAAGTIGQAAMWGPIPVGLLVAVIGTAALLIAVRLLTEDRWAGLAAGLGVMLTMLVLSGRGPGGSVVVPAPADGALSTGVVWTFAVPVLVAIVVAWPRLSATVRNPEAGTAPLRDGNTTTN